MHSYGAPHRVWVEIDLDKLVYNYRQACAAAPGSQVLCVIKADAYGHGAVQVTRALEAAGATWFAVATPEEGLQLRQAGVKGAILLLGMVNPNRVPQMAENDIALTVGTLSTARQYADALGDTPARIHIKIDTGMNRIGLLHGAAVEEALAIAAIQNFTVEGIFSHFSVADEAGQNAFTELQNTRFAEIIELLKSRGLTAPYTHCANSAGLIAHPKAHYNMVRPGILLYGSNPCSAVPFPLRHPLSMRSRIVQVKAVQKGETVSYGRRWTAERDSVIATVAAGYADGITRVLSGRLAMLVHGQRAPQVGTICMDMCMLDVTGIENVREGDTATIIGHDGEGLITADEIAAAYGTISYEVFCTVGLRVPRLYYQNGEKVAEVSYVIK